MNQTSGGDWDVPLPPGMDHDIEDVSQKESNVTFQLSNETITCDDIVTNSKKRKKSKTPSRSDNCQRSGDKYRDQNRSQKHDRRKSRSRSRSSHDHHHHHHSGRRRRRTRSRSKSRSSRKHRKDNLERRHDKHSPNRRRSSRSRSSSRSKSHRNNHHRSPKTSPNKSSRLQNSDFDPNRHRRGRNMSNKDDIKSNQDGNDDEEEEEDDGVSKENAFKNDGSFLEMFKKLQEEQQKAAEEAAKKESIVDTSEKCTTTLPAFGKRRGGRILKTGMVEKPKCSDDNEPSEPQDAWSVYMKEVKRYKEACCDDDSKTRPLVK